MSFFALKVVALLSMLWDHVTHVWPLALTVEVLFFPDAADTIPALLVLQRATDYIGRIAAPIFLFSIANGCRHTRNFKKYALRLLIFACLAEYPYYLLFGFHGNIMFTLLLGLLTVGCVLLCVEFWMWMVWLVLPYVWALLASLLLERVFRPFMEEQGEAEGTVPELDDERSDRGNLSDQFLKCRRSGGAHGRHQAGLVGLRGGEPGRLLEVSALAKLVGW